MLPSRIMNGQHQVVRGPPETRALPAYDGLHGVHGNERVLERFRRRPRVGVLCASEDTARHYAQLFVQLRGQGTPIPVSHLWIAALVWSPALISIPETAISTICLSSRA